MSDLHVSDLRVHPLKSGAIRRVRTVAVDLSGFRHDRHWMVVDPAGECVTARTERHLLTLDAEPLEGGALRLTHRGGRTATGAPAGDRRAVTVHGRPAGRGTALSEPIQTLVREVLGRDDVTLLWCADPTERQLNPDHSRAGDHTAYADGYPVTLASLASLRELQRLGAHDIGIDRFRPNVVIDGDLEAFAEETWTAVTIGGVPFRVAKGVDRCSMTLIDPSDLSTGAEPIRTLARHRKREGKTWFCMHLIPDAVGHLAVGDPLSIA